MVPKAHSIKGSSLEYKWRERKMRRRRNKGMQGIKVSWGKENMRHKREVGLPKVKRGNI